MIRSEGDLTVKMKLHSLIIKDELQGCQSMSPQYLACSVLKNDKTMATPSPSPRSIEGREISVAPHDDDDTFTDALPDFSSASDPGVFSPRINVSHSGKVGTIGDSSEFESAEALILEQELLQGNSISNETFYEAQGGDTLDFVSMTFSTRSSSSSAYDGVDTQVPSLVIKHLCYNFLSMVIFPY